MNKIVFNTPIGKTAVFAESKTVVGIDLNTKEISDEKITETVLYETERQLKEYFFGERKEFSVEYSAVGTKFQKAVWGEISKIPFGETRTYGEIAKAIGKPKSARAVGAACGKNPIPIIIPCHRVVGANGKIGGFAFGTDLKKKLLCNESRLKGEYR